RRFALWGRQLPSGPVFPTRTDYPTRPGRNSWETGNPAQSALEPHARMGQVERTVSGSRRILAPSPLDYPPRTDQPDDSLPTRGPIVRVQRSPDADAAESLRRLPPDRGCPPGSGRAGDARGRLSPEPVSRRGDADLPAGAWGVGVRRETVRRVPGTARAARPARRGGPGVRGRAPGRAGRRTHARPRGDIRLPVLMSPFCDFEDLLLNDGCTGVAVVAVGRRIEVQLDEHKLLFVYARDLKPY